MQKNWTRLSSKLEYRAEYVLVYEDLVQLPTGEKINYVRIKLRDFVTIIPVLKNHLVMISNYRYPINEWSLELPSGVIDEGELPKQAAIRELEEETGYSAMGLQKLGWYYPVPGRSRQKAYVFISTGLLNAGKPKRENTEQQETILVPMSRVYSQFSKGKIRHSATLVALSLALPYWSSILCPCANDPASASHDLPVKSDAPHGLTTRVRCLKTRL